MLLQYDLVEVAGDPPILLKVVWADAARGLFALKDAGTPNEWPRLYDLPEVTELVASGLWTPRPGEMPLFRDPAYLPEEHRNHRDHHWSALQSLIEDSLPRLFLKRDRCMLLKEASETFGIPLRTMRRDLQRLFDRGIHRDALLPDWHHVGNPGKPRLATEEGVKRGRKPSGDAKPGVNVTESIRRLFMIASDIGSRNRKMTLLDTYHLCMRMFFAEDVGEITGGKSRLIAVGEYQERGLPRYEQFAYHVRKEVDVLDALRRRIGGRQYEMKKRALLSNSTQEAWGPAARYQIDATVLDVYIRSRKSKKRVVGRPTLYVVIDVFSRMIVGISVTLEHPSWASAMMALANAVGDKVKFCERYGITITPEEWPCNHICGILEGDRGEIESANIDHVLQRFNMTVENAAAFRADWKGIVESRFRILQQSFKAYVDGYVETDFRVRGGKDYRLDAVLDIDELTRIIIRNVLHYNNAHELTKYPRHPGMTEDRVPSVPREIWNWGVANVGGLPRTPREDVFAFSLMPTMKTSVRREGIYFHGRHYTCHHAVVNKWFEKAGEARFSVTISYDKRDSDEIYVHDPKDPKGFHVAVLTPGSRHQKGMNGWETDASLKEDKRIAQERRDEQTLEKAATDAANEREVEEARRKAALKPDLRSAAQKVSNIRQDRSDEQATEILGEVADFRSLLRPDPPTTGGTDPTPLGQVNGSSSGNSRPSVRERLRAAGRIRS
ncbi:Mu transposase C-terminal domain-containing protein [Sphingomonas sp. RIT328]|uniref:Mu transposase C-terminal domain-containing protein n=1 Tax=Sphingomonas sp. RIT328 TaxID=1470591 RepID=UPI0004507BAC|nr:Mu transposase C-terminal domain-containing protein [Sphingomonas sp. RIT328]EZP52706.1 Integrase catalytic subunit [Sphingomonas sp. RIT328]